MIITIDGEPPKVTAQQKGVMVLHGRPMFFTKKKVMEAERSLAEKLRPFVPTEPYTGAIAVSITWVFKYPKSTPRRIVASGTRPHVKRPDLDNLAKGVLDALTRLGFWVDDSQIHALRLAKWEGNSPYLRISICEAQAMC